MLAAGHGGYMREYKNYIFDLYGTLVDIRTNENKISLWKNMAQIFSMMGAFYTGTELKRKYKALVQEEGLQSLQKAREKFQEGHLAREDAEICLENVFQRLLAEKGVCAGEQSLFQTGLVFRSLSLEYIRLFEGVPELLARLREGGKRIYLLSNAQRMFTQPEMKMLGIYGCFDGILYSSDEGVKKPCFYFYDALFKRFGLLKEESVMIGNEYQADILGAEGYGIDSMYVFTAQSGREALELPRRCQRLGQIGNCYG